uniref:Uncharacterized protein n=1 Tax=Arundo donax TaxID=35708 RepID=A0A0A9EKL6_ARUDO
MQHNFEQKSGLNNRDKPYCLTGNIV